MPTKIRLQRKGKKAQPFYHIVIADGRAPRDGKYIERIGTYNPLTTPADINLKFDRALYWLQVGAQPTDTVRTILSYKGVLYKNHLLNGVKKGALTQEQADAKYDAWLKEKEEKIAGNRNEILLAEKDSKKTILEAEKKINEERAKTIAAKRLAELEGEEAKKVDEEATEADAPAEAAVDAAPEVSEEPKVEEKKEEVKDEKPEAEEKKEEVKAEEPKVEEKKEEVKPEEPKAEEKKEEVKAEEPKIEKKKEEEPQTEVKKEEKKTKEPKAEKKKEEVKAEEPAAEEKKEETNDEKKDKDNKQEDKKAE